MQNEKLLEIYKEMSYINILTENDKFFFEIFDKGQCLMVSSTYDTFEETEVDVKKYAKRLLNVKI